MIIRKLSLLALVAICAVSCASSKHVMANTAHRVSQFTHTGKFVLHNAVGGSVHSIKSVVTCNKRPLAGVALISRIPGDILRGVWQLFFPIGTELYRYKNHDTHHGKQLYNIFIKEEQNPISISTPGITYTIDFVYNIGGRSHSSVISFDDQMQARHVYSYLEEYLPENGGFCAYSFAHGLVREADLSCHALYETKDANGKKQMKLFLFEDELYRHLWLQKPEHYIYEANWHGFAKTTIKRKTLKIHTKDKTRVLEET